MKISSIQNNTYNKNFEGTLSVTNLKTKATRNYKIPKESDVTLLKAFRFLQGNVNPESGEVPGKVVALNLIENYINKVKSIVSDEFTKVLPLPTVKQDSIFSSNSMYSSFISEGNFTKVATSDFIITHDLHQ